MHCKLILNLQQGLIEAEGDKDFVLQIYSDFKEKIVIGAPSKPDDKKSSTEKSSTSKKPASRKNNEKRKTRASKKPGRYSLNRDINLYAEGNKPSLEDFIKGYAASSNQHRYLLIAHYLKEIKGVSKVGVDEVYTCLKKLGVKIPNIEQGLRDTASIKGWLDTSSSDDISITVAGENAIEHELRKTDVEEE